MSCQSCILLHTTASPFALALEQLLVSFALALELQPVPVALLGILRLSSSGLRLAGKDTAVCRADSLYYLVLETSVVKQQWYCVA